MQLLISTLILCISCQSLERTDYVNPLPPPRTPPSSISIGYEGPTTQYTILSQLTIQYSAGYDREEIIQKLRTMASNSGADGIILGEIRPSSNEFNFQAGIQGSKLDAKGYRLTVQFYRLDNFTDLKNQSP